MIGLDYEELELLWEIRMRRRLQGGANEGGRKSPEREIPCFGNPAHLPG